jgi:mRNA interferase RelE/StbE
MIWAVRYSESAAKQMRKMDRYTTKQVLNYMDEIAKLENPFTRGHGLIENKKGTWRYRVSNIRILCEIRNLELIIHVVSVGHRREIYR